MNGGLIAAVIASFLAAILSSMGMGGGGILLLYLTVFLQTDQLQAQGINLAFFIPIAIVSLIIHQKNHLVSWKLTLWCVVGGIAGVFLGNFVAEALGSQMLKKVFGAFLLIIGVRELFFSPKKKKA